ncbi:MAG: class I SAM-dependent methyltransferase, partial [Planctomycetota bacterium]
GNLEGVDLSLSLLQQYQGPAQLHLADCRALPLPAKTYDAVVVQGGLHHLPMLPEDLAGVCQSVCRILKPSGRFYVVEPWLTPFLRFVHLVVANGLVRRIWKKGNALATMIDHERETYENWLSRPDQLLSVLDEHFDGVSDAKCKRGKLMAVLRPRR